MAAPPVPDSHRPDSTRSRPSHGIFRGALNSQADVIVYTGDHPFWNTLGKFWIRLMSWLSYAY